MGKKIKLGIPFSFSDSWVGGSYYILNLIRALNTLEDSKKPRLTIFVSKESDFKYLDEIEYPYLTKKIYTGEGRLIAKLNQASRFLINRNITGKYFEGDLDVLFPASTVSFFRKIKKKIFWIPDFQEVYYPQYFSKSELMRRKFAQKKIAYSPTNIVFSSNNAANDFKKLYPGYTAKISILQFAVTHPKYEDLLLEEILQKHKLSKRYFFVSNQFWQHKNHLVVLKALDKIKQEQQAIDFEIAFSGKETDYRNANYIQTLKLFIKEKDLTNNVKFLGFIDRREQLKLMSNSIAVIQPSLFEGWSTVVEDVKAMNQNIIVSNLEVHKEQLGDSGYYFDPNNEKELINHMVDFLNNSKSRPNYNYSELIQNYGQQLYTVAKDTLL